jgi:DNA-directed RNA polymerase subunit RPC12/RpoP
MTTPAPSMRVQPEEAPALFARLCQHYGQQPDRRGWVHVTCPQCGKEGTRQNVHFSFSESHGARCQVCGYGANLKQLCARLDLLTLPLEPMPVVHHEPEIKHYAWMDELSAYLDKYKAHPWLYEAWAGYRGVAPEIVDRYHLGVGQFPPFASQCQHPRMMVPMFQAGIPVAFRGRGMTDCGHKKWLTTAMGGRSPLLYNGAVLLPEKDRALASQFDLTDSLGPYCRGRVLVVVENPVDAILMESAGLCVVATLGVTMWTTERPWTALLRLARPKSVVIMYDHDLPGNGPVSPYDRQVMVDTWKAKHPNAEPPAANGLRLASELSHAGIPARVFGWPAAAPLKADPGWMIEHLGVDRLKQVVG